MNKELLIIFIKNPVLGKVKTRLAATIGSEKALAVYQQLLTRTEAITKNLPCEKVVYYSDFIAEDDSWSSLVYQKQLQSGSDLGDRMFNAFKDGFAAGFNSICIIGSDCFELTSDIILRAFEKLQQNEVLIGPATDGGYYLLGLTELLPFLFQDKSWSTENVLEQTLQDIKEKGLSVALLPALTDVDEEKDLVTMRLT